MNRLCVVPLLILLGGIWLGCAAPQAVEMSAAPSDTEQGISATPAEGQAEEAASTPVESMITIDPQTQAVSGKAGIAILRPIADEMAFTKEKRGVDALVKAINENTEIECKLSGIVSIADLATLNAPLLILAPEQGLRTSESLAAIGEYVARGGVVLVDGSWAGNVLSAGTRITPRGTHAIMKEPYNLGESRQTRFRPLEAIEVEDRLGVIITNQSYAGFWSGTSGTEQTWATRLGINVLMYALKTSSLSKQEAAPAKPKPQPGGFSPNDIAPI